MSAKGWAERRDVHIHIRSILLILFSPEPAEIEWTMQSEAGRERVLRVLEADVRVFVDAFCEVDPKLHAPCSDGVRAVRPPREPRPIKPKTGGVGTR